MINFEKMNGLIPAIVQDAATGAVLMTGFMNREAYEKTAAEKRVTFWSRTKKRLWTKGETSGNFLNVVSMEADCDGDAVLIEAVPSGPVCHTGAPSCFPAEKRFASNVLGSLAAVIASRKASMPEGSYTAKLFSEGRSRIAQKVGEEAVELAIAAQHDDPRRTAEEAADLLYHMLVLLADRGIPLSDVLSELSSRMK